MAQIQVNAYNAGFFNHSNSGIIFSNKARNGKEAWSFVTFKNASISIIFCIHFDLAVGHSIIA